MPTPRRSARPSLPLDANRLLEVPRSLGVQVDVDVSQMPGAAHVVLKLAYRLVGAAEQHAIIADEPPAPRG